MMESVWQNGEVVKFRSPGLASRFVKTEVYWRAEWMSRTRAYEKPDDEEKNGAEEESHVCASNLTIRFDLCNECDLDAVDEEQVH